MILAPQHLQHRQFTKPLLIRSHKLPRPVEDLIRLQLPNHHQQLTRKPFPPSLPPRAAAIIPEKLLLEQRQRAIPRIHLVRLVRVEPIHQHFGAFRLRHGDGKGRRERHGAAEQRWLSVEIAEGHGSEEVVTARGLAHGYDFGWVAAILGNVGLDPFECGGDVFGAVGVVAALEGEAVGGEASDAAVGSEVVAWLGIVNAL